MDGTRDVNYLLSAMMQSGAALVAIMGGLVASRFASAHKGHADAQHARDLAESQRQVALDRFHQWDERLVELAALEWVIETGNLAAAAHDPSGIESILTGIENDAAAFEPAPKVRKILERLADNAASAREVIDNHLSEASRPPRLSELRALVDAISELVGDDAAHYLLLDELKLATPRFPHLQLGRAAGVWDSETEKHGERVRRRREDEANRLTDWQEEARDAWEMAETRARVMTEEVVRLQVGGGFLPTVRALLVVGGLMIVPSFVALVPGTKEIPWELKLLAIASFTLGLAMVGRYFWTYARHLSGAGDADPTNLGSLAPLPAPMRAVFAEAPSRRLLLVLCVILALVDLSYRTTF